MNNYPEYKENTFSNRLTSPDDKLNNELSKVNNAP